MIKCSTTTTTTNATTTTTATYLVFKSCHWHSGSPCVVPSTVNAVASRWGRLTTIRQSQGVRGAALLSVVILSPICAVPCSCNNDKYNYCNFYETTTTTTTSTTTTTLCQNVSSAMLLSAQCSTSLQQDLCNTL